MTGTPVPGRSASGSLCTCTVAVPLYRHATCVEPNSKYAVRLSYVEDNTEFDPACPFHGDHGTMVAEVRYDR